MKIKLKWEYADGEMDTKTMKLICIDARGKRMCGHDEIDAELAIIKEIEEKYFRYETMDTVGG